MLGLLKDALLRDRNRERKRKEKKPNIRQDSNPHLFIMERATYHCATTTTFHLPLCRVSSNCSQSFSEQTVFLFLFLAVVEMLLQRLSQNKSTLLFVFCLAFLLFSLPRFILFPVSFIANNLIIPFSAPTTLNHSSQDQ